MTPPCMPPAIRILGVDTSLRSTGVGVVAATGNRLSAVFFDRIRNPSNRSHSACLLALSDGLAAVIAAHQPEAVAIEGVFFAKNLRTTLVLGEARGAVIAQCARLGVPVYEYEPRRVKQAVVGNGAAAKEQIQRMVMSMLGLPELPQEDAADALALAICHHHNRTRMALLGSQPL
jgi:crossover junction endodeoxyribonuclease RuvC